jgi:hypothetical protein
MIRQLSQLHWFWKAMIAGLCGSAAHMALMYFKSRAGILPTFQPYPALQLALTKLTGSDVHPFVPWLLSWINGAAVLGFLFGRIYAFIPGRSGAAKGVVFGLIGWVAMGFAFFPLIGLGIFASNVGLGVWPALFQLAMFMTYSVVLGAVYGALNPPNPNAQPPR